MWDIQEHGRNKCRPEDRSRIGGGAAIRSVIDAVSALRRRLRNHNSWWF